MPVWQLDGARGFRPMSRAQRALAAGAVGVAFALTREGLLILVGAAAVYQLFRSTGEPGDRGALALFVGLVGVLAWLATIAVPIAAQRAVKSVRSVTARQVSASSVAVASRSARLTISLGECM